jgi:hypothetical protein
LAKILYEVDNSTKISENDKHFEVLEALSGVLESKTTN